MKKMTQKQRLAELQSFISLCFGILQERNGEVDYEGIAKEMGCHYSTVRRLYTGQFSLCVRFGTIQALGYAAGLRLEMTSTTAKVKMAA